MQQWIWQHPNWTDFYWQEEQIQPLLRLVRLRQGILWGKTEAIAEEQRLKIALEILLQNIEASVRIEDEQINLPAVRSSLAKHMGIKLMRAHARNKRAEGLARIIWDACYHPEQPLTQGRLFQWYLWFFPTAKKVVYRMHPVQFEAPPREKLKRELTRLIDWFNQSHRDKSLDPLLRAGICHFWFVTLYPFDEGNGRISRTLTDLALAQDEFYSVHALSATLLEKRTAYYRVLASTQRNSSDITAWLIWFLKALENSIQSAIEKIDRVLG